MNRNTRFMHRHRFEELEDDPMEGIANLFDVMVVFSVGLLMAFVTYSNLSELMTEDDVTIVKNPGTEDMVIITKEGDKIEVTKVTNQTSEGMGSEVGTVYRLENGETIYVPKE